MTPNPHPASENGDVIEQDDLLRRLNEVHFNPYTSEASLIREVTRDAFAEIERLRCGARIVGTLTGPLADGKLREALKFVQSDPCYSVLGSVTRDTITEALATPAPSPIDAEGMREACAKAIEKTVEEESGVEYGMMDDEARSIVRNTNRTKLALAKMLRALPTPAREIDRENLAEAMMNVERQENGFAPMKYADFCDEDRGKYSRRADAILSIIGGRHG